MTVTYSRNIATTHFGTFIKLFFRWKGSVYKLIWFELVIFLILYSLLSILYRIVFNLSQRKKFEEFCILCSSLSSSIPVAFVLGFYVSLVVDRWWEQFLSLPWPDNIAIYLTAFLHGNDDRPVIMRRTIVRYLNLALAMCFSSISSPAKEKFPSEKDFIAPGLLTPEEYKILSAMEATYNKYYVPVVWATSIAVRARNERLIREDRHLDILVEEITNYRAALGTLFCYDWINPPLVYTQVATLSVYSYFVTSLFAQQFLDPSMKYPDHDIDYYVPIFGTLQFIFYIGWLKVAESLINPFGDDDDDFDVNYLIERNLQISYLIVDEMHHEHPDLVKDAYWDAQDIQLPHGSEAKFQSLISSNLGNLNVLET